MEKLQLILTNPCSENWDEMQPSATGRYCDQCEKNIVDLTTKSDAELISFFKKKKENVCGRLLSSQINRELLPPRSSAGWHSLLPLAIGAIVASPAQAKELRPLILQERQFAVLPRAPIGLSVTPPLTMDTIRGSVVNEYTNEPLKGVKVREKGFENVLAITDSAGKFELGIKDGGVAAAFTFELNEYAKLEMLPTEGMVVKLSKICIVRLGGASTVSLSKPPLYVINIGEKSYTLDAPSMNEINPDWIKSINVLNGANATAIYGERSVNGVIIIEINKTYAKQVDLLKKKKVLR